MSSPYDKSYDGIGRQFFQDRLTSFTKWTFLLWATLVLLLVAMYQLFPTTAPRSWTSLYPLTIFVLASLGAIWLGLLRRKPLMKAALEKLDVLAVILITTDFGVTSYMSADQGRNVYGVYMWCAFLVFARSLVIPSRPRRTAWVSTLAFMPLVVAGVATAMFEPDRLVAPLPAFLAATIIFVAMSVGLATVATATNGSKIIFGLRRRAEEAEKIGQYELKELIGEGGMGKVYRAQHALLRRPTAIKLLASDRFGTRHLERFEREVQLTSQLTHPNTVQIYDYGSSPEGQFYYAMEYLDGIDLERLVRRFGAQPPGRVTHILAQVCAALAEAHRRNIVHRDIKPGNIVLCVRGDVPDIVKVVDFGLVKVLEEKRDDSSNREIVGTPAYLSPEAISAPQTVGPASDLYAVGAVGYYLCTGSTVFEEATIAELCSAHVTRTPVSPRERSGNAVPPALDTLLLRCLAKSPKDRPASAEELRNELLQLDGVDPWSELDAQRWWSAFPTSDHGSSASVATLDAATVTVDWGVRIQPEGNRETRE